MRRRRLPVSMHERRHFGRYGELYVISEPPRASRIERLGVRFLCGLIACMAGYCALATALVICAAQARP